MFGVNSINGSVRWLGVPDPLRTDGPSWINNILAPICDSGTGGTATNPNWRSQPGVPHVSVSVPWIGPFHAISAYIRRSPENMRSAARCVCDNILQENRMARMQSLSTSRSILRNRMVNQRDCDWDDLWDELVDQ